MWRMMKPRWESPVPEAMLRCDHKTATGLIRVPYRNVGFRCVKRLR